MCPPIKKFISSCARRKENAEVVILSRSLPPYPPSNHISRNPPFLSRSSPPSFPLSLPPSLHPSCPSSCPPSFPPSLPRSLSPFFAIVLVARHASNDENQTRVFNYRALTHRLPAVPTCHLTSCAPDAGRRKLSVNFPATSSPGPAGKCVSSASGARGRPRLRRLESPPLLARATCAAWPAVS